ncbi:MAG: YciI family protein [Kofleriaceae bacterium]|nr:YciI family protein [Kofleriaceae bacterium]
MLYAIFCYDSEATVCSWSEEKDAEVMEQLKAVTGKLAADKRLGPVARLMPTTSATTVRKGDKPLVLDGPFAETKEQLLGFYVVDCASLAAAQEVAMELAKASGSSGAFEIRPLMYFDPGSGVA